MMGSKTWKRIKGYLVKKVEAKQHYLTEEHLVFEFILINFLHIKEIQVRFLMGEEYFPLECELTNQDELKIFIPLGLIETINMVSEVRLSINNREVWLTEHPSYKEGDYSESLFIKNRYLTTRVKKTLQISNSFPEFQFNAKGIPTSIAYSAYDRLGLQLARTDSGSDSHLKIYAFKNRQFHILPSERDIAGFVQISGFSDLGSGIWRLFLLIGEKLHPLLCSSMNATPFTSLRHQIEPISRLRSFYLKVSPNALRPVRVDIENTEQNLVRISLSLSSLDYSTAADYALLLDDPHTGRNSSYPFIQNKDGMHAELPLEDLFSSIFTKRFFILEKSSEPKIHQFLLDFQQLRNTAVRFKVAVDSQYMKMRFYKRKDLSLGLELSKPKLRKTITDINGLRLDGMIGSTDEFIDSAAYLLIEDRLSLESIKVPVRDYFSINLNELDLIGLKSRDKTVFDFFILIETYSGELVRKEKIQYKKAKYKKDTFYSHTIEFDLEGNEHHFLLTTTPFNNLKLETFTIPADIRIPKDFNDKALNVWLIGERSNTAQGNGIVLFHWLNENTDVEAYYVIDGDSLDFGTIQHLKNVVVFGSPEHFEVAFRAGVLLCTHDFENILPYKPAAGFFGYEHTTKIFLQHGVLGRKNVEYHKRNYELPFDLFIVSSDAEKKAVVMDEMGYADKEVAVTGLARFDKLVQDKPPRDILLMPTWRDWINTDEAFLTSEYYSAYTNLIQNEKLLKLLEKYDINLYFYPHYRAQNYFENGISHLHERIKFIPLGSVTVQQLLIRHALLITDYSSVSFDFTLLNKPVVYYHFDVDRFFRRGILRPIDETFIGGIAEHEDELVNIIEDRILNHFANFDLDISGIIKYQDQNNSRRIYERVMEVVEEKRVSSVEAGE